MPCPLEYTLPSGFKLEVEWDTGDIFEETLLTLHSCLVAATTLASFHVLQNGTVHEITVTAKDARVWTETIEVVALPDPYLLQLEVPDQWTKTEATEILACVENLVTLIRENDLVMMEATYP